MGEQWMLSSSQWRIVSSLRQNIWGCNIKSYAREIKQVETTKVWKLKPCPVPTACRVELLLHLWQKQSKAVLEQEGILQAVSWGLTCAAAVYGIGLL